MATEEQTRVDGDVDHLFPTFRVKVLALLEQVNRETAGKFAGLHEVKIYEGYRSTARQEWLYAQGRTRPGLIVTRDRVPHKHGWAIAADIVGFDQHGNPSWDWPRAFWQLLGHAARTQGLEWGGDWSSFPDLPHVQMSNAWKEDHLAEIAKWLRAEGLSVPKA